MGIEELSFGSSEMVDLFGEKWEVERGRYRVRELRGTKSKDPTDKL